MKKILLLLVAAMFIISCDLENNNGSSSKTKTEKSTDKTTNLYGIKSGYIEYQKSVNKMTASNKVYFKDYGKTLDILLKIEIPGSSGMETRMVLRNGYFYEYQNGQNSGMKFKYNTDSSDYRQTYRFTEEAVKKNGGKKLSSQKILDRECDVFEIPSDFNSKSVTKIWVWKNIVMKITEDDTIVLEAVKFEDKSDFPQGTFEVPENVKFKSSEDENGDADFNDDGAVG